MNKENGLSYYPDQDKLTMPTILPKGYLDYKVKYPSNLSPLESLAEFVLNEVNYTIWFETNLDKAREISKYFAEDGGIFTERVMKMKNLRDYCKLYFNEIAGPDQNLLMVKGEQYLPIMEYCGTQASNVEYTELQSPTDYTHARLVELSKKCDRVINRENRTNLALATLWGSTLGAGLSFGLQNLEILQLATICGGTFAAGSFELKSIMERKLKKNRFRHFYPQPSPAQFERQRLRKKTQYLKD